MTYSKTILFGVCIATLFGVGTASFFCSADPLMQSAGIAFIASSALLAAAVDLHDKKRVHAACKNEEAILYARMRSIGLLGVDDADPASFKMALALCLSEFSEPTPEVATKVAPTCTGQANGLNFISLNKGEVVWLFAFDDANRDKFFCALSRYASNKHDKEFSEFNWYDTAVLSQKARIMAANDTADTPAHPIDESFAEKLSPAPHRKVNATVLIRDVAILVDGGDGAIMAKNQVALQLAIAYAFAAKDAA